MLSNDYSMSAKMLMHPKVVILGYLSAPFVKEQGETNKNIRMQGELEVAIMR